MWIFTCLNCLLFPTPRLLIALPSSPAARYGDLRSTKMWRDNYCWVSSLASSPLHPHTTWLCLHIGTQIEQRVYLQLLHSHTGLLFLSILANWFCSHLVKVLLLPKPPGLWLLRMSPFLSFSLLSPGYSWQILQDWGKMLTFVDITRYSKFCFLLMQGIKLIREYNFLLEYLS